MTQVEVQVIVNLKFSKYYANGEYLDNTNKGKVLRALLPETVKKYYHFLLGLVVCYQYCKMGNRLVWTYLVLIMLVNRVASTRQ